MPWLSWNVQYRPDCLGIHRDLPVSDPQVLGLKVCASRASIPALGRRRQADFWVWGQRGLQSEFQDSQGCTEKPCLKKTKNKKQKQKSKHCIFSPNPPGSEMLLGWGQLLSFINTELWGYRVWWAHLQSQRLGDRGGSFSDRKSAGRERVYVLV